MAEEVKPHPGQRPGWRARPRCVAKLVGADAELGNLMLGVSTDQLTGPVAARALLREIDGVRSTGAVVAPAHAYTDLGGSDGSPYGSEQSGSGAEENPQDIGRKFLASNGGCIYIDLGHLEVCTAEVLSAQDFVAAWGAMLDIVAEAQRAANARCAPGERVVVLVNSSDGLGNSYGSHLNFLVTRRLWDDLFVRRLYPSLFVLGAFQVSSIVCTGQGKVGAEHGRRSVNFQLSQRADFISQITGPQTTYARPLINSRDEPLCGAQRTRADPGGPADLARLHCIFYDSNLCQVSNLLKVGMMQIVLSMLEAGRLDAGPMLEDPLHALRKFSHDPGLTARARLVDGRQVTAVELQALFCAAARTYVDAGACEGLVPGAATIVELWEDTLDKLARRDFDALAPRLDWVLKRTQIERALDARGLDWSAPQAKHLDHLYASLDRDEGLYWALQEAGLTQQSVDRARLEHFRHTPPQETRAWRRAMLLRELPRERIRAVDWDRIELAPSDVPGERLVLHLPDPLSHSCVRQLLSGAIQIV